MTMQYEHRVTQITVVPEGENLYSEMATQIQIVDEPAGEFIEVSQETRPDLGKIQISPEEWPTLRDAIDKMIAGCRSESQSNDIRFRQALKEMITERANGKQNHAGPESGEEPANESLSSRLLRLRQPIGRR